MGAFFKILLSVVMLGLCALQASAQYKGLGSWNVFTVTLPGSPEHRWGGYVELQNRNYGVTTQFYYYEVKGGISYTLDKNNTALLGTGRYTTYGYDEFDEGPQLTETRLWEQYTNNQYLGRIKFEHRYRVEQRWFNTGYRNRFRYRLNISLPINTPKVQPGTLSVNAYDEVFFNNKAPHFERNRVAALLGYQFTKALGLQTGLLNQYNYSLTAPNTKYYLMLNATYQIQRK